MKHVLLSLSLMLIQSGLDNVLLEHGGLPHVLPLDIHLIFLPEQVEEVIISNLLLLFFNFSI